MSAQTIYTRLVAAGMSPVGACAMMGNMQAESGLRANNAQDGLSPLSDSVYTDYADRGLINFVNDGIGYGLCQWTYGPRKNNLLAFARSRAVSVGDVDMQVDFCVMELRTEYPMLWLYLCDATGVYEATEKICVEYERPAVNNVNARAQFANEFYMTLSGTEQTTPAEPAEPTEEKYWPPRVLEIGMYGPDVVALQGLLIAHGFPAGITGTFDNATRLKTMAFQAENGLYGDGIAGPLTWAALTKR